MESPADPGSGAEPFHYAAADPSVNSVSCGDPDVDCHSLYQRGNFRDWLVGANYNALFDGHGAAIFSCLNHRIGGTGGAISSLIVTRLTGYVANHNSYRLILWGNAVLMVLSVASTWTLFTRTSAANDLVS